ncbi:MAG: flagellar biosynthetic protein FliO [Planctomycetota bacterium]|jgi:flagellar biogenesis protein FliO
MSPFRFVNRLAALALVAAPAAFGQPVAEAAPAPPGTADLQRAESAPGQDAQPPQESRALGQPAGLLDRHGGPDGHRPGDRGRGLDPRLNEIVRVGWALGAVVLLLLGLRFVLRRVGGPLAGGRRPSGVVEVLARYPVARAQQLVLLKMCGRVVLLHQSKTGMTTLSEMTDPDEVASVLAQVESSARTGGPAGFPPLLDRLLARGGRAPDDEFARALGRRSHIEGKEVVDLTRRPRRRRAASGGGR